MEINVKKEKINIKKNVGRQCKSIMIEKDIVLPDNKPDIIQIQADNSNIYISKKEMVDNKYKIEGGIQTRINYLTSDGNNCILKIEEKFEEIFEIKDMNEDCFITDKIKNMITNILIVNERKIHFKAEIEYCIDANMKNTEEFISGIETDNKMQLLTQSKCINTFIGHGESKISVKEKIQFQNEHEPIEILKFDYEINNIEKKISYNKILVKADCCIKLVYQTSKGKTNSYSKNIPLMGFVDVENVNDSNTIDIEFNLRKIDINENSVSPEVDIEIEFNLISDIYQENKIDLLDDLYDLNYETLITKRNINVENGIKRLILNKKIEHKYIIEDVNQIFSTQIEIINIEKINSEIEVEIKAIYLYNTFENQNINKKEEKFKVTLKLENELSDPIVEILNKKVDILPDSSVLTSFDINVYNNSSEELTVIDDIKFNENERDNSYSMIIYFVKPGDTIWKIAKKFKSTIEEIVKVNQIEDENMINVGEKLFIPREV